MTTDREKSIKEAQRMERELLAEENKALENLHTKEERGQCREAYSKLRMQKRDAIEQFYGLPANPIFTHPTRGE